VAEQSIDKGRCAAIGVPRRGRFNRNPPRFASVEMTALVMADQIQEQFFYTVQQQLAYGRLRLSGAGAFFRIRV
jgi:hypothetical protein